MGLPINRGPDFTPSQWIAAAIGFFVSVGAAHVLALTRNWAIDCRRILRATGDRWVAESEEPPIVLACLCLVEGPNDPGPRRNAAHKGHVLSEIPLDNYVNQN
jgi:hypothetical protein